MKKTLAGLVLIVALAVQAHTAHAVSLTYSFNGLVTNTGGWTQAINGQQVSGLLQFDNAVPSYYEASAAHYMATQAMTLSLGDITYQTAGVGDLGINDHALGFDDMGTIQGTSFFFSEQGANFTDHSLSNIDGLDSRPTEKTWAMQVYDATQKSFATVKGSITYIGKKYADTYGPLFGTTPPPTSTGDLAYNPLGGNSGGYSCP